MKKVSRRKFLSGLGIAAAGAAVAACQPKTVVVTQVVTQQVEKVVTQQVEKVVTQQVEKVVTATPVPVQAGADTGTVTILGAFRGAEETAFNSVISAFEAKNPDINILYSGTAEFETLISVRVEAGDPPDIAAFPQPGAVAKLAREGKLVPLWDSALAVYDANYPAYWKELSQVDGVPYAMFHRVNAKGWIWYNKTAWDQAGYKVPTTWDELTALEEQMKGTDIAPWGDGIASGAATGWKGTDWIENFMLRTQPVSVYDEWTAGKLPFSSDQVKNAWS
jgi:alpha-glucoside transport system substrate-binding protein